MKTIQPAPRQAIDPLLVTFDTQSAKAWRQEIAPYCIGNSRLAFAACCGLVAPLLPIVDMPVLGFHLWGGSATDRTLALHMADSVAGRADLPVLVSVAIQSSPKKVVHQQYALGKDGGVLTMADVCNVSARAIVEWLAEPSPEDDSAVKRAAFLCTGEGQPFAGVDGFSMLPTDAGAGLGIFSGLYGLESAEQLARKLSHRFPDHSTGAVLRCFTRWLLNDPSAELERIKERMFVLAAWLLDAGANTEAMVMRWALDGPCGYVEQAALRFALVGVAGAAATAAGLTGWANSESETAAKECFEAWLLHLPTGAGDVSLTA